MLTTACWIMALDPTGTGVESGWSKHSWERESWSRTSVGRPGGSHSVAMDNWAARHGGKPFEGGVVAVNQAPLQRPRLPFLLGGGDRLHLRDGRGDFAVTIWLNGVLLGGCKSPTECDLPIVLTIPPLAMGEMGSPSEEDRADTATSLVIAINTTANGQLRRGFTLD